MVAVAGCVASFTIAASAMECTYTPTFNDFSMGNNSGSSHTFNPPMVGPNGNYTIQMTAIDDADGSTDSCTSIVTVNDETPPVITCPHFTPLLMADSSCSNSSSLALTAPAYDACDSSVTTAVFNDTIRGTGVLPYNFRATDRSGNVADMLCHVAMLDKMGTSLSCPDPITLTFDENCSITIPDDFAPYGTDNCGGPVATIRIGPKTMTRERPDKVDFIGADQYRNEARISCPLHVEDKSNIGFDFPPWTITVPVGSSCTADLPPEYVINIRTVCGTFLEAIPPTKTTGYKLGTATVEFSVTGYGSSFSRYQEVTVIDQTPPVLSCPNQITLMTNASCEATIPDSFRPSSTDNCPGTVK
jgi:hypothetical protein